MPRSTSPVVTAPRTLAALAAGSAACLLAIAPEAPAIPFGADLDRPANNPLPCSVNPLIGIPWGTKAAMDGYSTRRISSQSSPPITGIR